MRHAADAVRVGDNTSGSSAPFAPVHGFENCSASVEAPGVLLLLPLSVSGASYALVRQRWRPQRQDRRAPKRVGVRCGDGKDSGWVQARAEWAPKARTRRGPNSVDGGARRQPQPGVCGGAVGVAVTTGAAARHCSRAGATANSAAVAWVAHPRACCSNLLWRRRPRVCWGSVKVCAAAFVARRRRFWKRSAVAASAKRRRGAGESAAGCRKRGLAYCTVAGTHS